MNRASPKLGINIFFNISYSCLLTIFFLILK
jgi:hypothetical protein